MLAIGRHTGLLHVAVAVGDSYWSANGLAIVGVNGYRPIVGIISSCCFIPAIKQASIRQPPQARVSQCVSDRNISRATLQVERLDRHFDRVNLEVAVGVGDPPSIGRPSRVSD